MFWSGARPGSSLASRTYAAPYLRPASGASAKEKHETAMKNSVFGSAAPAIKQESNKTDKKSVKIKMDPSIKPEPQSDQEDYDSDDTQNKLDEIAVKEEEEEEIDCRPFQKNGKAARRMAKQAIHDARIAAMSPNELAKFQANDKLQRMKNAHKQMSLHLRKKSVATRSGTLPLTRQDQQQILQDLVNEHGFGLSVTDTTANAQLPYRSW